MTWQIKQLSKPKLKNPILIEGLPGIGNVGKIAIDFMIDNLKAKKLFKIYSSTFPHSVFINEENLIELPAIEIYYKKLKNRDLLLVAGDVQPIEETACYEFCNKILDISQEYKSREIITLGGIGLQNIPKIPKVFCTANTKKIVQKYKRKSSKLNPNIYGVVGPIVGVSGLLLGLAKERKIPAISFLTETFAHPAYLGIRGAKETLDVLNKSLNLNLNLKEFEAEVEELEEEMKKITYLDRVSKLKKLRKTFAKDQPNYIG